MKKLATTLLSLFAIAFASAEEEWTYLFNDPEANEFYYTFLEDTEPEDVFKFQENGNLLIEGKDKSIGFIQTLDEYSSYEIETDWRWPGEPGNSGIQLHSTSFPNYSIWPESIEVQIEHENVGDFRLLNMKLEVEKEEQMPKKSSERRKRYKLLDAEKEPGEWNSLRIVVKEKEITIYLNDKLVNKGTDPSSTSGYITIQSEESNIEFRDFKIREIEDDADEN